MIYVEKQSLPTALDTIVTIAVSGLVLAAVAA